MIRNHVIAFIVLCLCRVLPGFCADTILLEPGTPVFSAPSHEASVRAIITRSVVAEKGAPQLILRKQHPLARYWYFTEIKLGGDLSGYVEPHAVIRTDEQGKKRLEYKPYSPLWRFLLIGALGAALLAVAGDTLSHRIRKQTLPLSALTWRLILIVVLTRQLLLMILVQGAGNIIASPADDTAYFDNAVSLMHWDFSRPWLTSLGHSLFYIPFILFTGASTVEEIMVPFSYFSGLVLAPLSLVTGFLIARRLTGNLRVPFIAMMVWAVLPFFYGYNPDFNVRPMMFVSDFHFMSFDFNFAHYQALIAAGFNSMSDVSSTLLVLATVYLALRLPSRLWSYAVLAAVYAFACLIRINNICFIPVLAFIVPYRFGKELFASWRYFLSAGVIGCGVFLLMFSPQFAINHHFSGRLLGFGYITLPGTEPGAPLFSPAHFLLNGAYLGGSSHLIWTLGICSLWFMRDRAARTILGIWIFPIIAFFLLYLFTVADPVRFILTAFPAFFIAMAGCEFREKLSGWEWVALAIVGVAWILAPSNVTVADWRFYLQGFGLFNHPLSFKPSDWVVVILLAGGIAGLYRHRRLMLFLLAVSILNLFGNAYLLILLLAAVFIRSLADAALLLSPYFKRVSQSH